MEGEGKGDSVPRTELEEMLATFRSEVSADLNSEVQKTLTDFETRATVTMCAQTANLLQKYDAANSKRMSEMSNEINELKNKQKELEKKKKQAQDRKNG